MKKTLDVKLAALKDNLACRESILTAAKDADLVAPFGSKINAAEDQLSFIQYPRYVQKIKSHRWMQ